MVPDAATGRLNRLLDELERTTQNDRESRDLFTPRVSSLLSDLSVLVQCQNQLNCFQPWASTFCDEANNCYHDLQYEHQKRMLFVPFLNDSMLEASLAILGDPSDHKFRYPIDKRRTRETTAILQASEHALDEFWHKVDKVTLGEKDLLPEVLIKFLKSNRVLHRTPNWVEPSKSHSNSSQQPNLKDDTRPLSETYYELQQHTEQTISPSKQLAKKSKPKTRGASKTSSASPYNPPDLSGLSLEAEAKPTFHVNKRALKVFRTLLSQPSRTAQPGEVPWIEFLHAMESLGFASEKLYGSVWQFTPSGRKLDRGIQFHEPHPISKIPFRIARRMGRRLNRAYGWEGNLFCLQGK
ncbi:uncharacterized protein N7479_002909 [Penicillium vulpinum]|nr:uncharacterized protein N7479_002909 [Penicillium vulpinum]KAJ5972991.1 hypothetical protein N7479_002909 [Penicillium vulpinum]